MLSGKGEPVSRNAFSEKVKVSIDRVEGDKIILDGRGVFPKKVIIVLESGKEREYRMIKTRNGGYILN
jgi:hypothetical protein